MFDETEDDGDEIYGPEATIHVGKLQTAYDAMDLLESLLPYFGVLVEYTELDDGDGRAYHFSVPEFEDTEDAQDTEE